MSSRWASIVWTLLKIARVRAKARTLAALKTRNPKRQSSSSTLTVLAFIGALCMSIFSAFVFTLGAPIAQEVEAEKYNYYLANAQEIKQLAEFEDHESEVSSQRLDRERESVFFHIGHERGFVRGQNYKALVADVEQHFDRYGSAGFIERKELFDSPVACSLLALMLATWWLSLVLQSDGMELDTTRRRHPMWEYFLSLPIPQSAVFTAEAISPVMSNPFYWAAPVVIASVAGIASESFLVALCALPLGVPLVLAAAVCAKANEVLIMLRIAPRNRGAYFVVLAGLGMLFMFAPMVLIQSPKFGLWLVQQLYPALEYLPSARWLVQADTPLHWLRALATNLALAAGLCAAGILTMRSAAARGLEGGFGAPEQVQTKSAFADSADKRWWRDPLLHKELLWLRRDRSALVQIVLVPCLLIAVQAFNFNNMLRNFEMNWHRAAGLVMVFGGYMLFVAGPRALISEAPALGLILSWPRSLEDTLRMKVRVLFAVMSVIVMAALFGLMFLYPAEWLKLLGVALLWPIFGLSVVEKAVTLIRSPASSGEPELLPREMVWAAGLGNLVFGIGLFMGNWQAALLGLALNWVLAGALWQTFKARLPYLFDPDSQPEVRPPTILSSVLAILGMQELGIVFSIPFLLVLGSEGAPFAMTLGYGFAGGLVCLVVWNYHQKHSIGLRDILFIEPVAVSNQLTVGVNPPGKLASFALALVVGVALGALAIFYTQFLHSDILRAWLPNVSKALVQSDQLMQDSPNILRAYGLLAIAVAPWVEEFLFRGLMFRAMLSQWGFWPSMLLSTAFFTLLHPVTSWPMVFLLGGSSAWLFVRTRSLLPCVALHFFYNTMVIAAA